MNPSAEKFSPNLSPNGFNVELAVLISDILGSLPSKILFVKHSFIILVSEIFAAEIFASLVTPVNEVNPTEASIAKTPTTTTSSNRENPF